MITADEARKIAQTVQDKIVMKRYENDIRLYAASGSRKLKMSSDRDEAHEHIKILQKYGFKATTEGMNPGEQFRANQCWLIIEW